MNKSVLLLSSQHGDEPLGEMLFDYIKVKRGDVLDHVAFIMANPRAREANVRFIETDMNRSYGKIRPSSYEEKQAHKIETFIKKQNFVAVLDLHTTRCIQQPSILVADLHDSNASLIAAFAIKKILVMNLPIVKHSLIGRIPQALSIEIQIDTIDDALLEMLCDSLARLVSKITLLELREVYNVDGLLTRDEMTPYDEKHLENFTLSSNGYYPILTGDNSYRRNTNYLGFKASSRDSVRL